jgi:PKD repeat protein
MKKITTLFLLLLINLSRLDAQQPIITHNHNAISFIENGGQWPDHVLYKTDLDAGSIWLDESGILYQFKDYSSAEEVHLGNYLDGEPSMKEHLLYAKFIGSNPEPETESKDPTREYYNYYIGNDPSKWASDIHGYGSVAYKEIYQGIDLLIFEKNVDLKYEFHVSINADPNEIAIEYHGHKNITLLNNGNLRLETSLGELVEQKPYTYQIINGQEIEVECNFKLLGSVLTYDIGDYDINSALIIDPTLMFATYCGSVTDNFGMTATYGYDGTAYSAGVVYGNAYPTPDPLAYDTNSTFLVPNNLAYGITDVFISKYSSDGTDMIWTTFLGGGGDTTGTETAHSLICDSLNNLYVYGATSSIDFPVTPGAFQSSHAGGTSNSNFYYNGIYFTDQGSDIYIAKISADGTSLLGSTYVGGSGNDGLNYNFTAGIYNTITSYDSLTTNYGDQFRGELKLDAFNNVLVVSQTRSLDFPVLNPFQGSLGGQQDAVIFKLSSDFTSLISSSYFGGTNNDAGHSISLNSLNEIVISGGTSSNNIPGTTGGLAPSFQGGKADGYIAKISSDGSSLLQTTYIGTPANDQCYFTDVDFNDNVVVFGNTNGAPLITPGVYSNPGSGQFIQSLDPGLSSINYATVFGNGSGIPDISPSAFKIDECGNIYCSGWGGNILQATPLSGMPITANAFQLTPANGYDFYLLVLENNAQSLIYGSYLGGSSAQEHVDGGTSRFDSEGILYQSVCAGCGGFSDFPTTPNAWSSTNLSSNCNNAVVKFDMRAGAFASFTPSVSEACDSLTLVLTNTSTDPSSSVWNFPSQATIISGGASPVIEFDAAGSYTIGLTVSNIYCSQSDSIEQTINIYDSPELSVIPDTIICPPESVELIADSYGTASAFIWDTTLMFNTPLNPSTADSSIMVSPTNTATYYIEVTEVNGYCVQFDSVIVEIGCVGIEEYQPSGVSLYPNPSSDHFKLDLGDIDPSTVIVTITNMFGQVVLYYNDLKDEILELSPQQWSGGIYFISVNDRITEKKLFMSKLLIE